MGELIRITTQQTMPWGIVSRSECKACSGQREVYWQHRPGRSDPIGGKRVPCRECTLIKPRKRCSRARGDDDAGRNRTHKANLEDWLASSATAPKIENPARSRT